MVAEGFAEGSVDGVAGGGDVVDLHGFVFGDWFADDADGFEEGGVGFVGVGDGVVVGEAIAVGEVELHPDGDHVLGSGEFGVFVHGNRSSVDLVYRWQDRVCGIGGRGRSRIFFALWGKCGR